MIEPGYIHPCCTSQPEFAAPAVPVGVPASSYFDTLRSMTDDPEVLAAADRVEAEVGVQPEPAEEAK